MSGQKAIEFTTQALTTAATEVKGVEHESQKLEEDSSQAISNTSQNPLAGSAVFGQKQRDK